MTARSSSLALLLLLCPACDAWEFETRHLADEVAALRPFATCVVLDAGGPTEVGAQAVDTDDAGVNGVSVTVLLAPGAGLELAGPSQLTTARHDLGELRIDGAAQVAVSVADEDAGGEATLYFLLSDRAAVATQVTLRTTGACD